MEDTFLGTTIDSPAPFLSGTHSIVNDYFQSTKFVSKMILKLTFYIKEGTWYRKKYLQIK